MSTDKTELARGDAVDSPPPQETGAKFNEAVAVLREEGLDDRQIAQRLGVDVADLPRESGKSLATLEDPVGSECLTDSAGLIDFGVALVFDNIKRVPAWQRVALLALLQVLSDEFDDLDSYNAPLVTANATEGGAS